MKNHRKKADWIEAGATTNTTTSTTTTTTTTSTTTTTTTTTPDDQSNSRNAGAVAGLVIFILAIVAGFIGGAWWLHRWSSIVFQSMLVGDTVTRLNVVKMYMTITNDHDHEQVSFDQEAAGIAAV